MANTYKKNQTVIFMKPDDGATTFGVITKKNKTQQPPTWDIKEIGENGKLSDKLYQNVTKNSILSTKAGIGNIGVPWAAAGISETDSIIEKLQGMTLDEKTPPAATELSQHVGRAERTSMISVANKQRLTTYITKQLEGDNTCRIPTRSQYKISQQPKIIISIPTGDTQVTAPLPHIKFEPDADTNIVMNQFKWDTDTDSITYKCERLESSNLQNYYVLAPSTSQVHSIKENDISRFQTDGDGKVFAYIDRQKYNFYYFYKATPRDGTKYNIFVEISDTFMEEIGKSDDPPPRSPQDASPMDISGDPPPAAASVDTEAQTRAAIQNKLLQLYQIMDIKRKLDQTRQEEEARKRREQGARAAALNRAAVAETQRREEEAQQESGEAEAAREEAEQESGGRKSLKRRLSKGVAAAAALGVGVAAAAKMAGVEMPAMKKARKKFDYDYESDSGPESEPEPKPEPESESESESESEPKPEPAFDMSSGVPSLSMDGDSYGFVYY